jgi:hypothetical protein
VQVGIGARQYREKTFAMYSRWSMQEAGMVPLTLDFSRRPVRASSRRC